ncbi:MAG TPA: transcriptional regulator [Bacteroidetes bacterium]|jgi:DNA-binding transcriptional ArsR family regulator|nr:MAG: ArsR family transcriptional regulator [Sphingobacteriales bacterium BACL12 MAG-120802-bin5]KRP12408.1 MAG: ArsR family transcriptional regulator [Sphingobacteriales bacterium BACL12 MAG-120813-bin55]HCK22109.1 transcriptional regulator [Bacteroidota bacterium]
MAASPSVKINNGSKGPLKLEHKTLRKTVLVLRAVNHKLRLKIIKMLSDKQQMSVTEIYVKLRLEQSVASQHLAIMRRAGIVNTTRSGKNIYYELNASKLKSIGNFIRDIS